MKILIWKSNGSIRVYDVSTPDKLRTQIEDAIDCLEDWGLEDKVDVVQTHIEKHPDDLAELTRAFNTIKNAVEGSDAFEQFYIGDLQ
jgi:uncharacterized protein YqgV (UPF0045/DUF77 family)